MTAFAHFYDMPVTFCSKISPISIFTGSKGNEPFTPLAKNKNIIRTYAAFDRKSEEKLSFENFLLC